MSKDLKWGMLILISVLVSVAALFGWMSSRVLFLGLSEIAIVNIMRMVSVTVVVLLLKLIRPRIQSSIPVLTWGGLRGGLSIALALSVPRSFGGEWIITSTYVMVVFSILVQGSTMGLFLRSRLSQTPVDLVEGA